MTDPGKKTSGAAALAVLVALSATAAQTVQDDSGVIDEVVVTGTWIPGTPEDDALPVNRIDREDLAAEGSPGIIELVRNLSFSQGADGESDQYGSRTGADRATVNLRGLGPSRTLVMLNSHRLPWSPGSVPDQAQLVVDVNLLPMAALRRIEVLRDGATATYGSDAVAGVVNFITRADFEGVEVEARHKLVDGSGGDQWLGLIGGRAFGDGAGSVVSSLGLARRSPLPTIERDWAVRSYDENRRGGWSGTGAPAIFVPLAAFAQTSGDAVGMRDVAIVDPNCERLGGAHTNAPAGRPSGGVCRFRYTPFVNLVQDTRRWQWFSEASWRLDAGTQLSAELLLAETSVPSWKTSPSYPPSDVIDPARRILANHPALVDMASKYPALYGDYAYCDADYCRWQGDGADQDASGVPAGWQHVAWINGRHFGQGGPTRGHPRRSTTERGVVKAEGTLGTASWDAALTYARSRRLEEDGAGLHYRSLRSLLGLGGYECEGLVPNRFDDAGNLHFDWRTVLDHAGRGPCRYWSPCSNAMPAHANVEGSSNPAYDPAFDQADLADYLLTARGFKGSSALAALDAVVHGDSAWQLGGGVAAYAAGLQIRREDYVRREYSAGTGPRGGALQDLHLYPCRGSPAVADCTSGRTGVFVYLPPGYDVDANRLVYAAFGETSMPLTARLEANLSLRYERYPDQGLSSLDPKIGMRWQAAPGLAVRASAGTAFRAPTINQIEPGIATTSRQFVTRIATFKPILALGNPISNQKPRRPSTSAQLSTVTGCFSASTTGVTRSRGRLCSNPMSACSTRLAHRHCPFVTLAPPTSAASTSAAGRRSPTSPRSRSAWSTARTWTPTASTSRWSTWLRLAGASGVLASPVPEPCPGKSRAGVSARPTTRSAGSTTTPRWHARWWIGRPRLGWVPASGTWTCTGRSGTSRRIGTMATRSPESMPRQPTTRRQSGHWQADASPSMRRW